MCREDTPPAETLTTEVPPTMPPSNSPEPDSGTGDYTGDPEVMIKNAGNVNLTEKGAISVACIILALVVIDDTLQVKVGEDNSAYDVSILKALPPPLFKKSTKHNLPNTLYTDDYSQHAQSC